MKKKMLLIFAVLAVGVLVAALVAFLATDVFVPFAIGSIDERGEKEMEQIRQEEIAEYLEWAHLYAHRRNAFLDDLQAIYDA